MARSAHDRPRDRSRRPARGFHRSVLARGPSLAGAALRASGPVALLPIGARRQRRHRLDPRPRRGLSPPAEPCTHRPAGSMDRTGRGDLRVPSRAPRRSHAPAVRHSRRVRPRHDGRGLVRRRAADASRRRPPRHPWPRRRRSDRGGRSAPPGCVSGSRSPAGAADRRPARLRR